MQVMPLKKHLPNSIPLNGWFLEMAIILIPLLSTLTDCNIQILVQDLKPKNGMICHAVVWDTSKHNILSTFIEHTDLGNLLTLCWTCISLTLLSIQW